MILPTRFGKIYYRVAGEGSPLVLIHGASLGESGAVFNRCVKRLAREYRVYTVDLLGFGKSDKPRMEYSAYLYASLINTFLREAVNGRALVAARGRGAAFAVMAAALSPENFSGLYLIKPTGMPSRPVKRTARAFFIGKDGDLRHALTNGFLDADYERALTKIKTPARVIRGGCRLCLEL